ncbi:YjfB family protein [Aquisalibacillus elongatus]|uniref:Putative motility protein YjfB-like n=1 Tax=Aquisalibacillus elongatus TaxID=485577 RepID=A0A3N5C3U6_9BACI|nr:YjfB family protein [Aquisalibacillus elongatus]RPF54132.1 putative motility protein YjfB-like [Aquisalibacillus elongatus]
MDVAAASVVMNQAQLKQQVGVSVMNQAKDQMQIQSEGLQKLMDSAHPNLGNRLDVKA